MSSRDCRLPFTQLAVWHTVRLQPANFYSGSDLESVQTVTASPLSASWKYGHFDAVIFNVEPDKEWPCSGLSGESKASVLISRADYLWHFEKATPLGSFDLFSVPYPLTGKDHGGLESSSSMCIDSMSCTKVAINAIDQRPCTFSDERSVRMERISATSSPLINFVPPQT